MWHVVHELKKSGLCFVVRFGVGFSFCVVSTTQGCVPFLEATDHVSHHCDGQWPITIACAFKVSVADQRP